ncbi:MAG: glycosyltransferase family A protein, partial [Candidatus Methylomirabilales bacterium]
MGFDEMACGLTTVIASSGRPELLRRTLESLAACRKPAIYRATIIVENGGKAGAEDVVRGSDACLNARYLYERRANKCHALNVALEHVAGGLIFFTDDDVRIHPDTLCAYADAAASADGGQFFGGPIGVDYDVEPPEWLRPYLPPSARGLQLENALQPIETPVFLGFNWAAFVNDLREAGGFDASLGPGATTGSSVGDETEMQARLLTNG